MRCRQKQNLKERTEREPSPITTFLATSAEGSCFDTHKENARQTPTPLSSFPDRFVFRMKAILLTYQLAKNLS